MDTFSRKFLANVPYLDTAAKAVTQANEAVVESISMPITTSSSPATLIRRRLHAVLQVLMALAFLVLWMLADNSSSGTLWRGAWYGAALSQALISGMLLCELGSYPMLSRANAVSIVTLTLPFVAPLAHVMLLEAYLSDMDRGSEYTKRYLWIGRSIAALAVLSALITLATLHAARKRR